MGSIHNTATTTTTLATLTNIRDFDICPTLGFIPADLATVHDLGGCYRPWDDVVAELPALVAGNGLRRRVRAMPVLRCDELVTDARWRRAYLWLAVLTQACVFEGVFEDGEDGEDVGVVPPSVAVPFLEVCEYWGLRPVLSVIGYSFWNWSLGGMGETRESDVGVGVDVGEVRRLMLQDLKNVVLSASFTGTLDEKVFTLVPTLVEAEGGCMVSMLLDALRAAEVGDVNSVVSILEACVERLVAMAGHLKILHEQCDPLVFYDSIRPWISGSQGMETKGLPHGFIFEHADGRRIPSKHVGASAVQSSLFQFLDSIFGIEHKTEFLEEMRNYMPRKHRHFLALVDTLPSLRDFVRARPEEERLHAVFEQCVSHLRAFRTKHLGIVMRYIVMPSKRFATKEGEKGTAGSLPIPFLKEIRDETVE